ncbi:MAG: peptide MFS transporter [Deltaproteobacteria bacterium]|nr:peptide MFS transporter [Deltaproteobacteria bacterium]
MKLQHPKGLYILFFTEMWERFSFYGMRSLLVLYMTKRLLYGDATAYGVYGAYGALVYATPVIGGFFADRFLGYRRAVILGAVLMTLGHFMMALTHEVFFYGALALIVIGCGFFKPNISCIVGKLYPEGGQSRDAGFTIFYMGINLGAFLAPLVCGVVGETIGWHYGFALAGVGMIIGLITFIKGQKYLEGLGLPPVPEKLKMPVFPGLNRVNALYLCCAIAVPVVALGLHQSSYVGNVLYVTASIILTYLFYIAFTSDKVTRDRLLVIMVLMFFHTTFWAFFEQAGSSLTLFADRNVDRTILGWVMPASFTQSFNPFFIILLAPLFSKLWMGLQKMGRHPSIPFKFVLGLVQLGLGFGILVFGATFAKTTGVSAMIWLVLAYLLHTTGELCLSPVGLSAVSKLSPANIVGTVFGAWFLTISFSHHLAAMIAKLTRVVTDETVLGQVVNPIASLPVYSNVFFNIFVASLAVALILTFLTPLLKRWMHGVE